MDESTPKPESLYRDTTDPRERRRIQAAVIANYRNHVRTCVRKAVPAEHYEEAEQVGALGLLVALEQYDPKLIGPDRGAAFWWFARLIVQNEIQRWMDVGIYWRKAPNRGKGEARQATRDAAQVHRTVASMDAPLPGGENATLHDLTPDTSPSVEDLTADAESCTRLRAFAATLLPEEAELLMSENGHHVRSRHYLTLVGRARAFVRGSDGSGKSIR